MCVCVCAWACVPGSCRHLAAAGEAGRGWETREPIHGCRAPWNREAPRCRAPELGTGSSCWGGWAVPSCSAVSRVPFFFPSAESCPKRRETTHRPDFQFHFCYVPAASWQRRLRGHGESFVPIVSDAPAVVGAAALALRLQQASLFFLKPSTVKQSFPCLVGVPGPWGSMSYTPTFPSHFSCIVLVYSLSHKLLLLFLYGCYLFPFIHTFNFQSLFSLFSMSRLLCEECLSVLPLWGLPCGFLSLRTVLPTRKCLYFTLTAEGYFCGEILGWQILFPKFGRQRSVVFWLCCFC